MHNAQCGTEDLKKIELEGQLHASRCMEVSLSPRLGPFRIPDSEAKSECLESSPSVLTEWVVHLWVTESPPGGTFDSQHSLIIIQNSLFGPRVSPHFGPACWALLNIFSTH